MKKKIISFLISCAIIILMLAGCAEPSWEAEDFNYKGESAEMGPMFEIDGITYRYLPETFWRPLRNDIAKYLGKVYIDNNIYPGGSEFYIYNFEKEDVNKIFLILKGRNEDWFSDINRPMVYYYRADITLPPFDRTGIDVVGYEDGGDPQNGIKKMVQDIDVVNKLFDIVSSASNSQDFDTRNSYFTALLWCMNSNFPGIGIYIHVYAYGQDYWIEIDPPIRFYNDNWSVVENIKRPDPVYAKIPQDLLETIAGEKLPSPAEYIAGEQATANQ